MRGFTANIAANVSKVQRVSEDPFALATSARGVQLLSQLGHLGDGLLTPLARDHWDGREPLGSHVRGVPPGRFAL